MQRQQRNRPSSMTNVRLAQASTKSASWEATTIVRPADATETVEAWRYVISHPDKPSMLVLTRQKVPTIDRRKFRPSPRCTVTLGSS